MDKLTALIHLLKYDLPFALDMKECALHDHIHNEDGMIDTTDLLSIIILNRSIAGIFVSVNTLARSIIRNNEYGDHGVTNFNTLMGYIVSYVLPEFEVTDNTNPKYIALKLNSLIPMVIEYTEIDSGVTAIELAIEYCRDRINVLKLNSDELNISEEFRNIQLSLYTTILDCVNDINPRMSTVWRVQCGH